LIRDKENQQRFVRSTQESLLLPIFFIILFFLLALRSVHVGRDLPNYHYLFQSFSNQSFHAIINSWQEVLFRLLNYGIGLFTKDFHWFLCIVAIIELLPVAYLYNQDKRKGYIKMILFVNMSTFILLFSGIRQSMAISFGVLAFDALKRNKKFFFLMWAVFATLMHNSGFMVFFIYFLFNIRLKKKHLLVIVPSIVLVLVFNQPIFLFLTSIVAETYEKYNTVITFTGAYGSLILFVLFALFSYLITDERRMDMEAYALRNILLMAVLLQCFAPLHNLAMRMNYYFIIFIPLAIGKSLTIPKLKYSHVARWGEVVMGVFFTFLFCYSTYISFRTGVSTLDTIPYVPFWSE
jgi:hypothetical protein